MTYQGGTWRRLKIAAEVHVGLGMPRLPAPELVRLLGLLAKVEAGDPGAALDDDAVQESSGKETCRKAGVREDDVERLRDLIVEHARRVDVRPFL